MKVDKLKDTLDGGFAGLFGEVVTSDIYRIKDLKFTPDVVIDIGANIGTFTRFAQNLFPQAQIISVEPDEENFYHLKKFTDPKNVTFINKAIGVERVWRGLTAANGSGATYISPGLGYPAEQMGGQSMEAYSIDLIMPDELIKTYVKANQKFVVKIDIEGNEHTIFTHEPSMAALKLADYLCMEVHFYALTGELIDDVREKTNKALKTFRKTHDCSLEHVNFYATKK